MYLLYERMDFVGQVKAGKMKETGQVSLIET